MASVDESLAMPCQSRLFTKFDTNGGLWQVPLDEQSRLLTTFVTPFGQYCFNRLPFGISSAPEIFQQTMSKILEGLNGVICHMDDVLIHGKDHVEHDVRICAVLQRLKEAGLNLNEKCEFLRTQIKFLGHIIDGAGLRVDPAKTAAIEGFPPPTNAILKQMEKRSGQCIQ